jgi:hypothetical protein
VLTWRVLPLRSSLPLSLLELSASDKFFNQDLEDQLRWTYHRFDHALVDHFRQTCPQDLVDSGARRKVYVLYDIGAVDECRICEAAVQFRNATRVVISERPMALGRLDVDMTSTFLQCLSLSSWVRRAFTT